MSKSRPRAEHFARLTQSLLESEAVATLPPSAFKALTLLSIGARPPGLDRRDKGSIGVQALTYAYARRFGFTSKDTLQRCLAVLLDRALIVKTREGWRSKSHFALYGVAWLPITHWDGEPLDTPRPANDSWRTWKSSPLVGHDDLGGRDNFSPRWSGTDIPDSRARSARIMPDSVGKKAVIRPDGRGYSKNLGTLTPLSVHDNGAQRSESGSDPVPRSRAAQNGKNGSGKRARRQPSAPRLNP